MKNKERKQERPIALKRKFMSALAMLLISTILMTTTSYAWFVLSTAPEVTGIETQVGANGSLEIALLNTETRADMSTIRAGLGGSSLQVEDLSANNAWGNLVDLGFTSYGLGELTLLPSRLHTSDGISVDVNKLLKVPSYGYDGRIIKLSEDTASAIYQETGFLYSGAQDYGVRAIGTSDALSPQGSALSSAKTNIKTYTKSAKDNTVAALQDNGGGLFNIILKYANKDTYNDEDKESLMVILNDLEGILNYLDLSLRQGLVAYAASEISNESTFAGVRDKVMDTTKPLQTIMDELSEVGTVPEAFNTWVTRLAGMQNAHAGAKNSCTALEGGSYTWDQIKPILTGLMNVDNVYVEGNKIDNLDQNAIIEKAMSGAPVEMTLAPGSGLFADIADFTDNYTALVEYKYQGIASVNIEMTTTSTENPAYLIALQQTVNKLTPADGGDEATALPLTATYGYAIDLAFRCNAAMPNLVLQTAGVQRVYNGDKNGNATEDDILSNNGTGQGGGSYMEFSSLDDSFTLEQRLALMDAIRVGFLDDTGNILAIAKLNVTARDEVDGLLKAPLYLYDYTFEEDETGLILTMGERRLLDNEITPLEQNVAKAVTVVVWLDGDIVDNTMVSATESASLDGVLNLQFATSAELVPAIEGSILNFTPDKSGLEEAVLAAAEIAQAGQGTYTNSSWNAFMIAYNRAVAVNDNDNAGAIEVRHAVNGLNEAMPELAVVSPASLSEKAAQIRAMMGTNNDKVARYVIDDGDNGYVAKGGEGYTQEEFDSWNVIAEIKSVDYSNNNLNHEGNEVYTPIYSDESWNALASALYQAEAVLMDAEAADDHLDAALVALNAAEAALERKVFFKPYEYNGDIYYMAICEADAVDTYGRWYDAEFNRIYADVMILKLDAYAAETDISEVVIGDLKGNWIASDAGYITPDAAFLEAVFPELAGMEFLGVHWNEIDSTMFTEVMGSAHYRKLNELITIHDAEELASVVTNTTARDAAADLVAKFDNNEEVTVEAAEEAILNLNNTIVSLYEALEEADTAMTSNQRTLLTAAVNSAKTVDGYDSKADLKSATQTAENLLAASDATKDQATDALKNLNDALVAADEDAITEYNTLTSYVIPDGSGDIVYKDDYPGIKLKLTGKSGVTTLGAKILTKSGVVVTVSKEITIYDKADKDAAVTQNGNPVTTVNLTAGETVDLLAALSYANNPKAEEELLKEEIKTVNWATTNMDVATVSGAQTGTVTAVAAGEAVISVSIETASGNFCNAEITVIVTP